jgi:TIGR03009 family protein
LAAMAPAQPPGGGSILPAPGSGEGKPAALVPALDPKDRLDSLLMAWEKRMTGVQSVLAQKIVRTEKTKTGTKVYEGEARYLHPKYAALRMIQRDNPSLYELIVCSGVYIYEYRPQAKKLVIHEMNEPAAGAFNNNFMQFLFGMSAADAKRRYELKLAKDVSAENPHYIYLDIQPRFEADKREFERAQMVLFANSMLPRRLWFRHPNGDEVLWDLPNVDTSVQLKPVDFTPPKAPDGWETKKEPKQTLANPTSNRNPPRIVRPSSR